MKRHPDRTISLAYPEEEILDLTLELVANEGMDITEAARHALCALPNPDPDFVLWLSQETLVRIGSTTYAVADLEASP